MKKTLAATRNCFIILLAGLIIGTALLTAAFCIPVNTEIAQDSLNTLYDEDGYPLANELRNATHFISFEPAVLDNVTDTLMLNNVFNTEEGNPLVLAMDMNDYARYWHGYVVLLRPLLYFMTYQDFRVLNCLCQLLLVFMTAFAIWKNMQQKRYVFAFLTSYALLMPLALPLSLQYTWVFYIAFGGSLFAISKKDFLLQKSHYIYFFLILGMLTSYFDLLTYPLITWGFPIIWWIVVSKDAMDAGKRFQKIILSGISWIAGYGVFWFLKWAAASPILGYNVISESLEEIFYRVGEVDEYAKELLQAYDRWEVFYTNWRHYEYGVYGIILVLWVLWGILHSVREGWRPQLKSTSLLVIACSSIVWYAVLSNHTTIHHFFTYRIYGVSILAFLIFMIECVPTGEGAVKRHTCKEAIMTLAAWGIFGVAGLALSTLARENISAIYGIEQQKLTVKEGSTLEATLIPTFSNIREIGFCLESDGEQGYYQIAVLQDGEILYQLEIPFSSHQGAAYHTETVNWQLDTQTEYQLQFTLYDCESCRVFITNPGNMPLNEYRNLYLDDTALEGQPLGSFTYHTRVQSRLRLAYAALMWAAVFGAFSASIKIVRQSKRNA